jgi:hypothetical protein
MTKNKKNYFVCAHKNYYFYFLQWDDDEEHPESSVSSVWIQVFLLIFQPVGLLEVRWLKMLVLVSRVGTWLSSRLKGRVADPHSFHPDPDPGL